MFKFRKFNIADWFSFYRIAAAPLLLLFVFLDHRGAFTWLLLISYSTDAIDGFLARKLNITSSRGSQLDSLGDQITLGIGIIGLFSFETDFMLKNLWLIVLAFVPYLIQMVLAYRKYGKATAFHTYLAKISAVTQAVFILWLLFFGPLYWLFYITIILGLIETAEEIALIFIFDTWVDGVKGLYWGLKDKRRFSKEKPSYKK